MKKWLLTILLLVSLLSACTGKPAPAPAVAAAEPALLTITAEGKLIPAPSAQLSFVQAGVIGEVLVQPGDQTAAGDVLARLVGVETILAEASAARLEQTLAQQALDTMHRSAVRTGADAHQALQKAQKNYENESRGWRLRSTGDASALELALDKYIRAEAGYRAAKTALDQHADKNRDNPQRHNAQQTLDDEKKNLTVRYAGLVQALPAADERVDDKQTALLQSISALELARQQVERLEKGLDREQIAAAEARLKAAEAHLAAAEAALAYYELRAPFAGTIFSINGLTSGEAAQPGSPVIFLANSSQWVVETRDLAEMDIAQVALGQKAKIKLDAFLDETFTGTVAIIDPVGREYLGDMTYMVTIKLDQPDPRFLWNMTAVVTIETE
jgi:multidrug resistance efflux pump